MRIAPGQPARLCKCRRSLTFTAKRIHKIIASSGGTFWVSRRSGCSSSQCKARWRHSLSTSLIIAFLVRFLSPAPSRQKTGEEEAASDVKEQKKLRLHAWIFPPHHRLVCFRHQLFRPHSEWRSVTRDGTAAPRGEVNRENVVEGLWTDLLNFHSHTRALHATRFCAAPRNKIKCCHISLACSVINTTRSDMIQGNTIKTQSL